ncbi:hypothetical protein HID58_044393 [Brassica napus]|uniref:Sugar phosphate transporter domain-containing protein n=2 Tax=Brassica napus TaxID=3708 RepID=A0ABQ8BJB4_BRANA|nr:hypothetical protein HID58_044393 [Brassica napus]
MASASASDRPRRLVVLVQHRSTAPEQVPAEQLRVQVPDLPHHVPHNVVLPPQLPRHRVDEDGPYADGSVPRPAPQDRGAEPRVLRVGRLREHLPEVFARERGYDAVFTATLKREAWLTYVTLVPVVTGVVIASGAMYNFKNVILTIHFREPFGVALSIELLSFVKEKLNSMNLLLYMAPIAVVFLLSATLIMEKNVVGITIALARDDFRIVWYLLFNSALAYFVNLTNFLVTKHTSALTLQVLGNAKGAVAVVVSILIFKNPVSVTGMLGYSLTVCGVILYSEAKKRSK